MNFSMTLFQRVCKLFAQKIEEHIHLLRAFRDSDRLRVRIVEGTENTERTQKKKVLLKSPYNYQFSDS